MTSNPLLRMFPVLLVLAASATAAAGPAAGPDLATVCPAFATWLKTHHKAPLPRATGKPSDPAMRKALLEMMRRDQAARHAMIDAQGKASQAAAGKQLAAVDAANLKRLAPMLDEHGFPSPARVGRDGVEAAFVLVQHADSDPAFQARMLPQLAKLHGQGEVSGQKFALLTDRVLRAQGKRQRYGTQFGPDKAHPGTVVLQPVEDAAHLDARRAGVGLPPLKDYACVLSATYRMPVSLGAGAPVNASGKAL